MDSSTRQRRFSIFRKTFSKRLHCSIISSPKGGQSAASYLGSGVDWPPALFATVTPNPQVAYFCAAPWSVFTLPLTYRRKGREADFRRRR